MSDHDVKTKADGAESASTVGLAGSLPWHIGFHSLIGDGVRLHGDWHPDMTRYEAVRVCAHNGRHVAWACSLAHAAMIVDAVNKTTNVELTGAEGVRVE